MTHDKAQRVVITERGSSWDEHDRAWAKYHEEKAKPDYKPQIWEKIEAERVQWERVDFNLDRRRVPGGWLYRLTSHVPGGLFSSDSTVASLAFVPDPSVPGSGTVS